MKVRKYFNTWKTTCPLLNYCNFCNFKIHESCCYFINIVVKTGECSIKCPSLKLCHSKNLKKLINEINKKNSSIYREFNFKINNPLKSLPEKYNPRIQINSENQRIKHIRFIKENEIKSIVVSLKSIISDSRSRFSKMVSSDLHSFLKYNDFIILQTTIPDIKCDKIFQNIEAYKKLLIRLNPDAITTLDSSFYLIQPTFLTKNNINEVVQNNFKLKDIDIPQIGLIPPTFSKFRVPFLKYMLKCGYKIIALPLLGANTSKDLDIIRNLMASLNRLRSEYDFRVLALHTSPRSQFKADYYSSFTWNMFSNKSNYSENQLSNLKSIKIKEYNTLTKEYSLQKKISDYFGRQSPTQL